ncbi:hypothetical protein IH992_28925 [Candidatus Poribacteria bacterium]|nr:hypothetical protein [Candidatus Poribacteria bacterium]
MTQLGNFTLHIFLFMVIGVHAAVPQVQFTDVTAEAGIQFRHVNGAQGDYHLPETIGSGGAFLDYNNDGNLDLYLVNSGNWRHTPSSELERAYFIAITGMARLRT